MKKHTAIVFGLIVGLSVVCSTAAQAHGGVQWSVTVGNPGYVSSYTYTPPPRVVVSPQPQYIYGAPPSAFAQPPQVIYVYPQHVYPPPTYHVTPPARLNVYPNDRRWDHHHGHRRHDWHDGYRRWDHHR